MNPSRVRLNAAPVTAVRATEFKQGGSLPIL
jgi:hypothetical protein